MLLTLLGLSLRGQVASRFTDNFLRVTSIDLIKSLGGQTVDIRVVNESSQPVTAFAIGLVIQYSDSTRVDIRWSEDFLVDVVPGGFGPREALANLGPGASLKKIRSIPKAAFGGEAFSIEATVKMALFDDGHAIGDSNEISSIEQSRHSLSRMLGALMAAVPAAIKANQPGRSFGIQISELSGVARASDQYYSRRRAALTRFASEVLADPLNPSKVLVDWEDRRKALAAPIRMESRIP